MRDLSPKIIFAISNNSLAAQIIKRIDELFLKSSSAFFVIICTFFISHHSLAQEYSVKLKWLDTKTSQKLYISDLAFDNISHYDENRLPIWAEKYPLSNVQIDKVVISNEIYEPILNLKNIDIKHLTSSITNNFQISYEKKKPYLLVNLIPLRLNPKTGGVEKLKSFSITPVYSNNQKLQPLSTRTYASSSVLTSGNWYKLGITTDGIYKISYKDLENLGIEPKSVTSTNIQLYGNGGGMLPRANNVFRHDDLTENPIIVFDGNDGNFDENDYILFYGQGPNRWQYDSPTQKYHHFMHLYSDTTFYFITLDRGPGKRISNAPIITQAPTYTSSFSDEYTFYDLEAINLLASGELWVGETFDIQTTREFNFELSGIDLSNPIYVKTSILARNIQSGGVKANFNISLNGSSLFSQGIDPTSANITSPFAKIATVEKSIPVSTGSLKFIYNFNKPNPGSIGWLDYIELNYRKQLLYTSGKQFSFRDSRAVGVGAFCKYIITNIDSSCRILDVTNPLSPQNIKYTLSGNTASFISDASSLTEYIIYKNQFFSPICIGSTPNQNLHSINSQDMVIVSHPSLLSAADRLAEHHRQHDNLKVTIVTPNQIYNEFSSGSQDISAIRDFMKMLYDKAKDSTQTPKYLLILGDGSYDPKNRISGNTNYVVTFQSKESLVPPNSYTSDDYFTFYDDNEGNWGTSDRPLSDVAVGRIPAKNPAEAEAVVNKIINYSSTGSLGDWRNNICFVGDDYDSEVHDLFASNSEEVANLAVQKNPNLNIDKIYLDSYKQESTPGGDRYPDATIAINERVEKGALILNYIGHGGEKGWTHERVLGVDDILSWTNFNKLPLFMTATCEFSRYDNPALTSAGELLVLNPSGGGIASFTTVRVVYASSNQNLNTVFYKHVFELDNNNNALPIGEIFRRTKNGVSDPNTRNFSLLGDPAVCLNLPKYKINTTSVITNNNNDTLSALSKVTITGYVANINGQKLNSFNGTLSPTVFDKAAFYETLHNDDPNDTNKFKFSIIKQAIFRGKASITNGDFKFSFIVPKDIAYQYGNGRLSFYADNGQIDASGANNNVVVGGISNIVSNDVIGPKTKLYMNDEKFIYGGITNQNPKIYAVVEDSSGINMVGNGIGHDLSAILDEDTEHPYILNEYYQADLNSYQKGKIIYPLKNLNTGHHNLKLKTWDVYNNSSEATTEFVVANSAKIALEHVLNYPNPFTTHTTFFFQHNKPGIRMQVQIQIFTISGKLVKTISSSMLTTGFRSEDIEWDGKDDFGDKIGRGVYVYRVRIKAGSDSYSDKYQKLVVLN